MRTKISRGMAAGRTGLIATVAVGLLACDGGLGNILISDAQEVELGKSVDSQIELQQPIATETDPVTIWARQLVAPLEGASVPFRDPARIGGYKVEVIADLELVNAFAAPGGFTYISTGLIMEADSCAEIAGVMGHELAHVTERHGIEKLGDALGFALLADIVFEDGIAKDMVQTVFTIVQNTEFSQEDESEADTVGLQISKSAGYNPFGLTVFFQKLLELTGDPPSFLSFLSSHPPSSERVAATTAQIGEIYGGTVTEQSPEWGCIGTTMSLAEIQAHITAGVAVRPGTGICPEGADPATLPAECQPPVEDPGAVTGEGT